MVRRVDRRELLAQFTRLLSSLLTLLLGVVEDDVFHALVQLDVGIAARLLAEV